VAGSSLIAYFVHQLGLERLAAAFQNMGWGILVLLALPLFLFVVHALGWSYTLSPQNRQKIGLLRLTALQTFSYGISGMLPMQVFVSEPLKLAFLRDTDCDMDDVAASLLVDNTINGISIFTLGAAGLVYLAAVLVNGVLVKLVVLGLLAVSIGLFAGLILIQKRGLLTGVLDLLGRLSLLAAFRDRNRARTERIDLQVRSFYQQERRGFLLALFFHLVEKAHGVAEFWVIFHLLGMEVSWGACFFVFSVVSTLDNLLFFAQVGGMEAWVSSLLTWMNITRDSINITAALFRRVRLLFWAVVALLLVSPTRRLLRGRAVSGPFKAS